MQAEINWATTTMYGVVVQSNLFRFHCYTDHRVDNVNAVVTLYGTLVCQSNNFSVLGV
jgi:hypothetical protein